MTLIIQKPTGAKLNLRKTWQPMDADAAAYITAVETADGQALEEKVKIAIDNFVLGCKADGIWSAIKASCILAGARTLSGALVPLVGTAPTRFGTEGGWDYNRKTGLQGNGSDNYLNTNRNNNADPQDSNHACVYLGSLGNANGYIGTITSGNNYLFNGAARVRSTPSTTITPAAIGVYAVNRSTSSRFSAISARTFFDYVASSVSPTDANISVFRIASGYQNARLSFYSIGEALDLAKLDARVTDVINAFGAAIP